MKSSSTSRFTTFAWIFVAYLILVILFGAWVRITHSGAGCGDHWPTCHGEIIPIAPSTETVIEYTHRVTSGFCGILGIFLMIWAFKIWGATRVFWASAVTFAFICFEGAIGAGLVLAELVAQNDSVARAVVIALHLANTLMLTGSAALVAWWSAIDSGHRKETQTPPESWARNRALILGGVVLLIATSMSGAVTALGDTLFPVDPTLGEGLFARVRDDLSAANHFLVRLRIAHPIIAIFSAIYLLGVSVALKQTLENASVRRLANVVFGIVILQTLIGFLNVGLYAPGWLQLTHLLVAQALWIALVLLGYEARPVSTPSKTNGHLRAR